MNLIRHTGPRTAGEAGHSQFGTPLKQIIHADVECNENWLLIPTRWDPAFRCSDPKEWAEDLTPDFWGAWVERTPGADEPTPEMVRTTELQLAAFGERYGGFDPKRPFEIVAYLYVPDPNYTAILTRVWVDDRPDLTIEEAAGVDDPDAIDNPTVEKFSTDALGTGVKVTRHGTLDRPRDDIEGTGIFVAVRYAFQVPNRQAVVTVSASTNDLSRMAAAQADLDEFVRTITLSLADGTPVVNGEFHSS